MRQRYTEHRRYIKNNDPKSAYALHILDNKHEYGTIDTTLKPLHICRKGRKMNNLENFYVQKLQQEGTLIPEQNAGDENLLYRLALPPHPKK
jgi:hypothetical protein